MSSPNCSPPSWTSSTWSLRSFSLGRWSSNYWLFELMYVFLSYSCYTYAETSTDDPFTYATYSCLSSLFYSIALFYWPLEFFWRFDCHRQCFGYRGFWIKREFLYFKEILVYIQWLIWDASSCFNINRNVVFILHNFSVLELNCNLGGRWTRWGKPWQNIQSTHTHTQNNALVQYLKTFI